MGILDKKTRFIDLVITQEGKRQIADGKLRAEYASLSDCHAFYLTSSVDDVASRIYFEVMERPENAIVLEKDDSGQIFNFNFSPTGSLTGNDIFIKDTTVTGSLKLKPARDLDFTFAQDTVFSASLNHFKNNYFIGTNDISGKNDFEIDNKQITFTIDNGRPFTGSPYREIINVNDAEPFFFDSKLAHIDNFKFLPPRNQDGTNYGNYVDLRSTDRDTWDDIKSLLGAEYNITDPNLTESMIGEGGYLSQKLMQEGRIPTVPKAPLKQVATMKFDKTSTENNLIIQVYEDSLGATLTKLDVIDAGVFIDENDVNRRFEKRVFYIGKIFEDDLKIPTFINMFTMIMD